MDEIKKAQTRSLGFGPSHFKDEDDEDDIIGKRNSLIKFSFRALKKNQKKEVQKVNWRLFLLKAIRSTRE